MGNKRKSFVFNETMFLWMNAALAFVRISCNFYRTKIELLWMYGNLVEK